MQKSVKSRPSSRRRFLKTAPALAGALRAAAQNGPRLVYIASSGGPGGQGGGIYLFEMHPGTGAITGREWFHDGPNPGWLVLDAAGTHLYAVNDGAKSASAYAIEKASGRLTPLNTESSQGTGPCHASLHPSGKYLFVANYSGGTVAVLPVRASGELGAATDVQEFRGQPGPARAASAPAGSFAISGHERTHAHMVQPDPSGRFVLATDLGRDLIVVWRFDDAKGKLLPHDPPGVSLPAGDGPRHFAFHPNGQWLYSLQEEGSTLAAFAYDGAAGTLTLKQTLSTLPEGFAGTNFTSEVRVSPDARFVYAANRLHDSIAWFSIGAGGELKLAGEEWTRGDYPRSFTIDPSGQFLYCCNQRGDVVTCFRVNRQTGALAFTGQYTPVGAPAVVVFL